VGITLIVVTKFVWTVVACDSSDDTGYSMQPWKEYKRKCLFKESIEFSNHNFPQAVTLRDKEKLFTLYVPENTEMLNYIHCRKICRNSRFIITKQSTNNS
jgi:hypothetical protein